MISSVGFLGFIWFSQIVILFVAKGLTVSVANQLGMTLTRESFRLSKVQIIEKRQRNVHSVESVGVGGPANFK